MNYENAQKQIIAMARATDYWQGAWSHACGAGACFAGNGVYYFGLEENEVMVESEIRLKRPGYDQAVGEYMARAKEAGANLRVRSGSSKGFYPGDLSSIRNDHSSLVGEVSERMERLLGVSGDWAFQTKIFYGAPGDAGIWPEPYRSAWRATSYLPTALPAVGTVTFNQDHIATIQRGVIIAYFLALVEREKELDALRAEFGVTGDVSWNEDAVFLGYQDIDDFEYEAKAEIRKRYEARREAIVTSWALGNI